jgi:hypothetical protein
MRINNSKTVNLNVCIYISRFYIGADRQGFVFLPPPPHPSRRSSKKSSETACIIVYRLICNTSSSSFTSQQQTYQTLSLSATTNTYRVRFTIGNVFCRPWQFFGSGSLRVRYFRAFRTRCKICYGSRGGSFIFFSSIVL